LNRGLSISDFYTNFAGQHGILPIPSPSPLPPKNTLNPFIKILGDNINPLARDKFNNPLGREYDLGREGAFGR